MNNQLLELLVPFRHLAPTTPPPNDSSPMSQLLCVSDVGISYSMSYVDHFGD